MNLGLDMSLKLQQKLSFQMIQSLKLLQVNTLQLEQLLKTELEMNPVLEATEELEDETEELQEQQEKDSSEDKEEEELDISEDNIDWEEYLEEGFDLGYSYNEEVDKNEERYEPTPIYQITLEEHLNNQLAEKKIDEKTRLLVQLLIGSLDIDGYLRIPLEDLADFAQVSVFEIEEALHILWKMEPYGVGARNLRECILLQLRYRGLEKTLAMRIVDETWDLFEKLKIPEISRHFGVEPRQVQEALDTLKP